MIIYLLLPFLVILFQLFLTNAQILNGNHFNSTQCVGVFDFDVNMSVANFTSDDVDDGDLNVMLILALMPPFLQEKCKVALREINCFTYFSGYFQVDYCPSACSSLLSECDEFVDVLLSSGETGTAFLLQSLCDFASDDGGSCVSGGELEAYSEDEPVCPLVRCFNSSFISLMICCSISP